MTLYLTRDRIDELMKAVRDTNLSEPEVRNQLLFDIHPGYVAYLPILQRPYDQIGSDLNEMNKTPCLSDLTVPLSIWLKNAVDRLERISNPQVQLFQTTLEEVNDASQHRKQEYVQEINNRFRIVKRDAQERGLVRESIADASINLELANLDQEHEIEQNLLHRSVLPMSLFYVGNSGYWNWIRLTEDPIYTYYKQAIEYYARSSHDIAVKVLEHMDSDSVDYISLGPGDGKKDRLLISSFLKRTAKSVSPIYYYPIEINPRMAARAISEVVKNSGEQERIKAKAIITDLRAFPTFEPIYQYRDEPNLVALLGNTLGNMRGDLEFLRKIYQGMKKRDVLLLEVRTADKNLEWEEREQIERSQVKNFLCGPLSVVGWTYDVEDLSIEEYSSLSEIESAKTIVGRIKHVHSSDGREHKNVNLFYIHHYERDALVQVAKKIGFKEIARPAELDSAGFTVLILGIS